MGAEDTGGRRWAVTPTAAWTLAEDGAAVVMDVDAGLPLRLSPTGSAIWRTLLGGLTPEDDLARASSRPEAEVTAGVAAAFEVDPAVVRDDVAAFLDRLAAHGVVRRG